MLRRRVVFALMRIAATVALLLATVAGVVPQPTFTTPPFSSPERADPAALRRHVEALAAHRSADHLAEAFRATGARVIEQSFVARKKTYRNIIATFGQGDPVLVIGAHYDVFNGLPGADDNASGTAAL